MGAPCYPSYSSSSSPMAASTALSLSSAEK
jgi:hypothetical protein